MEYVVLPPNAGGIPQGPRSTVYLESDNWNDYWDFQTLYHMTYRDANGLMHQVGPLKIGQFGWPKDQTRPTIPDRFESLSEQFFSLGASEDYYSSLAQIPFNERDELLRNLNDMVRDRDLFVRALPERVTQTSLLRDISPSTVRGQFRRVLNGEARLTAYNFVVTTRQVSNRDDSEMLPVGFSVLPESMPPTNVHVLIGRNGVGKTRLLDLIRSALVADQANASTAQNEESDDPVFSSVVTVSFSAFDAFRTIDSSLVDMKSLRYRYIGLRYPDPEDEDRYLTKTDEQLAEEFGQSVGVCLGSVRRDRWQRALSILQADPLFMRQNLANWSDEQHESGLSPQGEAVRRFGLLSSGHKIVLLTITKLVEVVEESTVVMLDEPEAHLHPPLLSAFVRSLSDLLINRNGMAIVATHSPVVLQEVPKSCVWILERSGYRWSIGRPTLETFGENVSILTEEVFGLEVTHAGFHTLIQSAVSEGLSYSEIVRRFGGQLGGEAKAIVQALVAERDVSQS